jgi:release factor glutamine methyltransferase
MTIQEAQQKLLFELYHIYDNNEAAAITNLIMENLVGWKKIDRILNKNIPLSLQQVELFTKYSEELSTHKPVQYVLHEAWFCNMKFYVDENVLIPRPETEELVDWISSEVGRSAPSETQRSELTMLDVGTGCGCISIALKKKLNNVTVYSSDISGKALEVAKRNALSNNAAVNFLQLDFLNIKSRHELPDCNIIVSNPPYIPLKEKATVPANVINFEPHIALFVNDNDPLVFYKAIADFAVKKLLPHGAIYAELHEDLFLDVKKLLLQEGFQDVIIKKDLQGKYRMVKATLLP